MKYKSYSKYKDSGIEWIGEIPSHWDKLRLKYTIESCQNGIWGDDPDAENDILCVRVADFDREKSRVDISNPTYRAVEQRKRESRILRNGDLLLEKSGGGEQQPVGFVVLFNHDIDAVCSNFIAKMTVRKDFDSTYLCYVHSFLYTNRINTKSIKQTTGIQNLDSENYLGQVIFLPKLDEQRAIANSLEIQTSKIDVLIDKKQRLIKLLREKRTALISQAVTKGLEQSVPMKDSGVEWLGKIPSHWEVRKLKHLANVKVSNVDKKSKEDEKQVMLCNYTDVYYNDRINSDSDFMQATATSEQIKNFNLRMNDVLITKDSEAWDDIAVPAYVPLDIDNVLCGYHLAQIRPNPDLIEGEFLFYLLCSDKNNDQFKISANGITRFGLSKYAIANSVFPIAPIEEQREIITHLRNQTDIIVGIISKTTESIEKLKEYRAALISAVVTGKIEVRGEMR